MKEVYNILEEIRLESSTKKKLEILKNNSNNLLLQKVLIYTYDPFINFYIKDYEESYPICFQEDFVSIERIFNLLDDLKNRVITGNEAKNYIKTLTHYLCYESRQILRKIIDKNLRIGIDVKGINKIFKGLIVTKKIYYNRDT